MPWNALVMVRECYDPTDYGPDDEVELVDEGEGIFITKRKDWFRLDYFHCCRCLVCGGFFKSFFFLSNFME